MGPLSVDTWSNLEGHIYFYSETHRRIFNPKKYTQNAFVYARYFIFIHRGTYKFEHNIA